MAKGGILLRGYDAAKKRLVLSGDANGCAPEKYVVSFQDAFPFLTYVEINCSLTKRLEMLRRPGRNPELQPGSMH
jgi:hypothetical protein